MLPKEFGQLQETLSQMAHAVQNCASKSQKYYMFFRLRANRDFDDLLKRGGRDVR